MNIQRLTEILDYNPSSGLITYRHNGKTLEIMEDRLVKVKDPETKQQRKFKMEKFLEITLLRQILMLFQLLMVKFSYRQIFLILAYVQQLMLVFLFHVLVPLHKLKQ
jgi:hypothetical protein